MKKVLTIVAVVALVAGAAIAWNANGWGDTLTVTPTAQRVTLTGGGVYNLKVMNEGSAAILCAVNCTAAEFITITNAGTAVAIAPTDSFTFSGYKDRGAKVEVVSFNAVAVGASTSTVYCAGW